MNKKSKSILKRKKTIGAVLGSGLITSSIAVAVVAQTCNPGDSFNIGERVLSFYNRNNPSIWSSENQNPEPIPGFLDLVTFFRAPVAGTPATEGTLAYVVEQNISLGETFSVGSDTVSYYERINNFFGMFPNSSINGFKRWEASDIGATPTTNSLVNLSTTIASEAPITVPDDLSELDDILSTLTGSAAATAINNLTTSGVQAASNILPNIFDSLEAFSTLISLGIFLNALNVDISNNANTWATRYSQLASVPELESLQIFREIRTQVLSPLIRNIDTSSSLTANYWNILSNGTQENTVSPFGSAFLDVFTRQQSVFFEENTNEERSSAQFSELYSGGQGVFFSFLPNFAGVSPSDQSGPLIPQLSLDINLDISVVNSNVTFRGNIDVNFYRELENADPIIEPIFTFGIDDLLNPDSEAIPAFDSVVFNSRQSSRAFTFVGDLTNE